ncbi:NAC domain-containing protein 8 [Apostasia shenzhenica]|uniref:NAC domain-containing protein 8 n=1 Tax=Apostasia shenzhenica TaxID=1088818 RepID=A0A2I0BEC9_9ASPA|nr:NAC domain-containing protein 8 [Apostasia shenzhenica]
MVYRAWLINSRGIAKKVKNASTDSNYQIRDLGGEAHRECPNCKYVIDNSDVSVEWPGLPAGVKFDPSDAELLEHLNGKVGMGNAKAHILIDEFIPTLEGDQGICYTHPKNLPGIKKDGSSVHFFHRTSNAYSTGHRKRRKIHNQCSEFDDSVRWHKTGKTKPVMDNGFQKGWKKIMVLYRSSRKGCKPDKANWVMHQYHLGKDEDEKDGEMVVSKIFYQQTKQMSTGETGLMPEGLNSLAVRIDPRTPKTVTPRPPRSKLNASFEADEHSPLLLPVQDTRSSLPIVNLKAEDIGSTWWAGESQAVDEPETQKMDELLLCHEVLDLFPSIAESSLPQFIFESKDRSQQDDCTACGFSSLSNIEVDTPPDFQLSVRCLVLLSSPQSIFENVKFLISHYSKA